MREMKITGQLYILMKPINKKLMSMYTQDILYCRVNSDIR